MKLARLVVGASLLVGCGSAQLGELDEPHQATDTSTDTPTEAPAVESAPEQMDAFFCAKWLPYENQISTCGMSLKECESLKQSEKVHGRGAFGPCLPRSAAVCVRVELEEQEIEKCVMDPVMCTLMEGWYEREEEVLVRCRRISALELKDMRLHGTIPGAEP